MKTALIDYLGERCLYVDRDGEWLLVRPSGDILLLEHPIQIEAFDDVGDPAVDAAAEAAGDPLAADPTTSSDVGGFPPSLPLTLPH